jgi:serine/threonine protein kinase
MNPEIAEQKREVEEHIGLDHENVIKLLYVDEEKDVKYRYTARFTRNLLKFLNFYLFIKNNFGKYSRKMWLKHVIIIFCFRYLVLELCAGTLTDYCENKYNGPMPPDDVVLCQIAKGLDYIHSKDLVHRDVKPDNILISIGTPIQMKLSDFGFVKKISPQGTFSQSGLKGTEKWMAPEMLELLNDDTISDLTLTSNELPHGTVQSDTFASGCVFFYFLTRGFHPFGNSVFVSANVVQNKPVELIRHKQSKCLIYIKV